MRLNPISPYKRRAVITGIGIITPLGRGLSQTWDKLISGKSGIINIDHLSEQLSLNDIPVRIAGIIPNASDGGITLEDHFQHQEINRSEKFILFTTIAASDALLDAGILNSEIDSEKAGICIGSGIGPGKFTNNPILLATKGYKSISPFAAPHTLINSPAGIIAAKFGFTGMTLTNASACATGLQSIATAAVAISRGDANLMLAGGTEFCVNGHYMSQFIRCNALVSRNFNDNPTEASRPWDKDRSGFVISEGCALMVLEDYESAKRRGANIYCEIIGTSSLLDAYHITKNSKKGIMATMSNAINDAGITIDDIDYINAHAASTKIGDDEEANAVISLFKNRNTKLYMSSIKSSIGHTLGASGSIELAYSIQSLKNNVIPPTINLQNPTIKSNLIDFVQQVAIKKQIRIVLSNALGFGGINCSLIVKKI